MNEYIAYCGLNCENCNAYKATKNNDNKLRAKTAELWSQLNGVNITPEMINCEGCRADGIKTYYCEALCTIRQCALGRDYLTCGDCGEAETCGRLKMVLENSEEACRNMKELRRRAEER